MGSKPIRVGFDFDGVIAYNPARVVRPVIAYVKSRIFGVKHLRFWYPQRRWQQIFWMILHESSIFPAKGIDLFKEAVSHGTIEAHLISARYSFLDDHLTKWLRRHNLYDYFKSININKDDKQPHIFKDEVVKKRHLDYYIEDNLDIVRYVSRNKNTKVYWIYNLFDRSYPYPYKYPYLEKALMSILDK